MSHILRMAVAGIGWVGGRHVLGARELGRKVAVTCLVDRDPDHLKARAEEFGIGKTSPISTSTSSARSPRST